MSLLENFDHAMEFVLKTEGGLNTDVVDRGGLTKYGISKKAYPDLDIANLTLQDAKAIYYRDYWKKQKCEHFELPLAIVIFDSSVNCGRGNAGKWLQKALNRLMVQKEKKLKVDGAIGKKTLLASVSVPYTKVIYQVAGRRAKHYSALLKKYPKQVKFIRGWNNRLGDLLLYI